MNIPKPSPNHLILVGRIDSASFQQAKSCHAFLTQEKGFDIELVEMMPLDWQCFRQTLQDKLMSDSPGFENKAKAIVSDVVYDADFQICGPGLGILMDMSLENGFTDRTPLTMYQSAARTRLKKHFKSLSEIEGVKFLQFTVGRAESSQSDELKPLGNLIVMAFADACPQTTARFISLISNDTYKDCAFKYITDSYIQCDYVAVEPEDVPDESSAKHDRLGCIGFARRLGEHHTNGNTNQFYITLDAVPEFDSGVSRKQCFARVVDGMRYLKMLAKTERNENSPQVRCGIIEAKVLEF